MNRLVFIIPFLTFFAFNYAFAYKPKAASEQTKLCIKKFTPENPNLKLSLPEIAWIHTRAKSIEAPLASMLIGFYSTHVDRAELGKSLGASLEAMDQKPSRFKKAKVKDLTPIHAGQISSTDLLGRELNAYLVESATESLIILRHDEELTSTSFQIFRFKNQLLLGQGFFSWPPRDTRLILAGRVGADNRLSDAIEIYFNDRDTAQSVMRALLPAEKVSAYRDNVVRASELTELAAEEFLRHKKIFLTAQKLVEKVRKQKGKVIQAEIGTHTHKIYIAKINAEVRRDLAPYSVGQFFVDGAEVLIAIDTHGAGRLTVIDINALDGGQLSVYRQSLEHDNSFIHMRLHSSGLLYELPKLSVDDLIDSIVLLNRDLK